MSRKRLALVQIALGVPVLFVIVFGLVLAYRFADRPLGDDVFWLVLGTVLVAFALYFGRAALVIRRAGKS